MWAEIPGERLVDSLGEVATGVDERHPHELSVELPLPSEMGNLFATNCYSGVVSTAFFCCHSE